jgi:hypothetical protein
MTEEQACELENKLNELYGKSLTIFVNAGKTSVGRTSVDVKVKPNLKGVSSPHIAYCQNHPVFNSGWVFYDELGWTKTTYEELKILAKAYSVMAEIMANWNELTGSESEKSE